MNGSTWRGRGRGRGGGGAFASSTSSSSDAYRGHHGHHGGGGPYRSSGRDEDAQPNLDEGRNLRSANYFIGRREPEPAPPLVSVSSSSSHPWPARGESTRSRAAVPSSSSLNNSARTAAASTTTSSIAGEAHAQHGADGLEEQAGTTAAPLYGTSSYNGERKGVFENGRANGSHQPGTLQCNVASATATMQVC